MTTLCIHTLGSFQVSIEAKPIVKFESNKERALLAYLVVESGQAHNREKLADLLWPNMPVKRAKSNLSQALYHLRQLLDDHLAPTPYILRTRDTVQFNPKSVYWLDTQAFLAQLAGINLADSPQCELKPGLCDHLEAAVNLYRGDFLESLIFESSIAFDEWVQVIRLRLQRQAMEALSGLASYYADRGDVSKALPLAWRQVELDPLNESACRQLMQLLATSDHRNLALSQFERLRAMLAEELSVAPEPETLRLWKQIRGAGHLPNPPGQQPHNLPVFLTPLIGRQMELEDLQNRLLNSDCRLLTILGPGGSGKTRLALEAAHTCREYFEDGVFFVPLNPVQAAAAILPAIMEAVGLPRQEETNQQVHLTNYLREKSLLLVLDGFEHLLEGASMLAEILRQVPGLKILVTSRTRLNSKGEHLYHLSGLAFPQDGSFESDILETDAVQLLVHSLQRSRLDYQPATEDLRYLLRICQQVQGMPLGILLAASWGATLSLEEIITEIDSNLDFLVTDWVDVPNRQRSMRATFDHTWELLVERERRIFQGLSIFRGAFTRRAARVVSGASSHELRSLVDHSLIWIKSPGWYEVHELLRQYGREKLAGAARMERELCNRHSVYYLEQLVRLGNELKSAQQEVALSNLEIEHENYHTAWNWAVKQGESNQLAAVLDPLCLYYDLSLRYTEGKNFCQAVVKRTDLRHAHSEIWLLQTRAMIWLSHFTRLLGEPSAASKLLEQANIYIQKARIAGDETHIAEAFLFFEKGKTYFYYDRAVSGEYYQRSLQLYRQIEDPWGAVKALTGLGFIAHHTGRFKEAVEIYMECLQLSQKLGDPRGIANASIHLGQNMLRQGLTERGESYIHEGVNVLQQIGDLTGAARGWFELGRYYFWIGEFEKSCELTAKASQTFNDLGILDQYVFASIGLGLGLSHRGKYTEAIAVATNGMPLAQELGAGREIGLAQVILGIAYLGLRDFKQAVNWALKSASRYQNLNQQEELTLALAVLVYAEHGLGNRKQAQIHLQKILKIGVDINGIYPILYILFATALMLMEREEVETAIKIFALAERYPFVSKSCWFKDIAGRELTSISELLPSEVVAAAHEDGRSLDLMDMAGKLLSELDDFLLD